VTMVHVKHCLGYVVGVHDDLVITTMEI
jgi:hypothetical protein